MGNTRVQGGRLRRPPVVLQFVCFACAPAHAKHTNCTKGLFVASRNVYAGIMTGYKWGYTESDPEEEEYTVPKLVNAVYHLLAELCYENEPDFCPWTLGFLLGELTSLAERDRILALTGLAHFCFLLSFIQLDRVLPLPPSGLMHVRFRHNDALRAYRARVRACKEQGVCFSEAQRLALVAPV